MYSTSLYAPSRTTRGHQAGPIHNYNVLQDQRSTFKKAAVEALMTALLFIIDNERDYGPQPNRNPQSYEKIQTR
jgi:hypothetical protein